MGLIDKVVTPADAKRKGSPAVEFTLDEAQMMLSLIAKSEFKGSDLQRVYNLAGKVQQIYVNLKDNS